MAPIIFQVLVQILKADFFNGKTYDHLKAMPTMMGVYDITFATMYLYDFKGKVMTTASKQNGVWMFGPLGMTNDGAHPVSSYRSP